MNGNRRTLLGLALLGAVDPVLAAVPFSSGGRNGKLDRELAAIVQDPACELASLSVLAIRNGKLAYEGQFGRRWIGNAASPNLAPDLPANRDTLYRIASISKMMTTLGLMRLVEDGKADLDADVSGYLGFILRNPHYPDRAITLRHLLTHTSSLRDEAGYSFPAGIPLREFVVPGGSLHAEGMMWASKAGPGDYFTYCNLGWGIIGTLMERVTGERFDRLMQGLLLQPLGLTAGYHVADLPAAALANLATLYRKRTLDTEVWDAAGPWIAQVDNVRTEVRTRSPAPAPGIERYVIGENATPFSPTGGLRISARDLGVVMLMLMNDGVHAGRRILKRETLERMFARQWTADGKGGNGDTLNGFFNCWGLGNAQFPDQPGLRLVEGAFDAVGHLGDAYGLRSTFAFDRKRKNGMIVLVGGSSSDPGHQKGRYSALARFEERVLTSMFQHAIVGQG